MIYPPELEAILERPNTTDERRYSAKDVIDAHNLGRTTWERLFEGMRSERNIMQDELIACRNAEIAEARQAARREGHLAGREDGLRIALHIARTTGPFTTIQQIRALIDSPKAEVEESNGKHSAGS